VWELPVGTWPTERQCFVHLQPGAADLSRPGCSTLRTDLPAGTAERVEALLPGPDLSDRARAAFAWQDELLRELTSRTAG
jgi:hypothetical protein